LRLKSKGIVYEEREIKVHEVKIRLEEERMVLFGAKKIEFECSNCYDLNRYEHI